MEQWKRVLSVLVAWYFGACRVEASCGMDVGEVGKFGLEVLVSYANAKTSDEQGKASLRGA